MNLKNLSPSFLVLALLLAGCSEENAVSVDTLAVPPILIILVTVLVVVVFLVFLS